MKRLLKILFPETSFVRLSWHRSKALVAAARYGFPARKLIVIGITGTDGKTTAVGMVAHILHEAGIPVGALSTAFFRIKDHVEWNATQKTSPSPFIVQKFLRRIVDEGCTHAVLEYSSHGLLQGRMNFTWPLVAGITNIAEEHLDYHKTMEAYLGAKAILFTMLPKDHGVKVINGDDRSYEELSRIASRWTTRYSRLRDLGKEKKDKDTMAIWASNSEEDLEVSGDIHTSSDATITELCLPIAGGFNISNALCAIGCAQAVGVDISSSDAALRSFRGVPGRMERIPSPRPFAVYIDFAVTPQSYTATLTTLRKALKENGRLLALAGSCGDRMKEKRPIVGGILAELADIAIITNEDPYTEDPEAIVDEVIAGLLRSSVLYREEIPADAPAKFCVRVSDRLKAIRMILRLAKPGDIVLLCGKGSDTTMMTKAGQIPWNEREIVRDELKMDN